MTGTPLAFIDTETTGLDPDRHEIWEVALILRHGAGPRAGEDDEFVWQLPVDLSRADPIALNIGRFHYRRWADVGVVEWQDDGLTGQMVVPEANMRVWADVFTELTRGCHLVGNVVSFDADRLWRLLRRHGQCPMWHYHLIDVEALVAGRLRGTANLLIERSDRDRHVPMDATVNRAKDLLDVVEPPWDSEQLSYEIGVDLLPAEERHTALGDARWAKRLYDAALARPGKEPAPR